MGRDTKALVRESLAGGGVESVLLILDERIANAVEGEVVAVEPLPVPPVGPVVEVVAPEPVRGHVNSNTSRYMSASAYAYSWSIHSITSL